MKPLKKAFNKCVYYISHTGRRFLTLLCLSVLVFSLVAPCALADNNPPDESTKETVRVGYFAFSGYQEQDENGHRSGYGYDVLQYLKLYNNWEFEYIGYDKSWAEMLEMLENGDIDLLTSARKTPEREAQFAFSDSSIGTSGTIITCRYDDSRFVSEVYSSYDGMKVGMLTSNTRNDSFDEFANKHGFDYSVIYYNSTEELHEALINKEVDTLVTSNLRELQDERILSYFDVSPFYVIVSKENQALLDEVNHGLIRMYEDNPLWLNDLWQRNYQLVYSDIYSYSIPLTSSEVAYLATIHEEKRGFNVLLKSYWEPYAYIDDGEVVGIIPELFDIIAKRAGIEYNFIPAESLSDYNNKSTNGNIDLIIDWNLDMASAENRGYKLINSYMNYSLSILQPRDLNLDSIETLASFDQIGTSIEEYHAQGVEPVFYKSYAACIQAVESGKCDAALLPSLIAELYTTNSDHNLYASNIVKSGLHPIAIAVANDEDALLCSILSRACTTITEELVDNVIWTHHMIPSQSFSFISFFRQHRASLITAFLIMIALYSYMLIRISIQKRRSEEQNKNLQLLNDEIEKAAWEEKLLMSAIQTSFNLVYTTNVTKNQYNLMTEQHFSVDNMDYILPKEGNFDDLLSMHMELVHPEDRVKYYNTFSREAAIKAHAEGKKSLELEYRHYDKKHEVHWLYTRVMFIENSANGDLLEITIAQVIDERINRQLKHERELKASLDAAEQANAAKSRFLFNMSHDIRTPMNAIMGYASIASLQLDNKEKLTDYLRKILSSGEHLLGLINDVLDMSRIEAGKSSLNNGPVSLSTLLSAVKSMLKPQMLSFEQTLDSKIDIEHDAVIADAQKLRQIFANILSNAVKFTPPGGHIAFSLTEEPTADEHKKRYTFRLRDSGIGMSQEFLGHIFEAFSQERNSTTSRQVGTGLGMAITKSFVDMMGGDIKVNSESGKGTEFIVTLELELQDENVFVESNGKSATIHSFRGMSNSVLLVEDNELNREIAHFILTDMGFEVTELCDGKEAVERLKASPDGEFLFVLMDIQMPVMNGYEATKQIRAIDSSYLKNLPIIALSANVFSEDVEKCLACGMNAHVPKPFTKELLIDRLKRCFSNS